MVTREDLVQPRFLRIKDVTAVTTLSRATIYAYMKEDRFPKQIPLGGSGAVGWIASEVYAWCDDQVRAARPSAA